MNESDLDDLEARAGHLRARWEGVKPSTLPAESAIALELASAVSELRAALRAIDAPAPLALEPFEGSQERLVANLATMRLESTEGAVIGALSRLELRPSWVDTATGGQSGRAAGMVALDVGLELVGRFTRAAP